MATMEVWYLDLPSIKKTCWSAVRRGMWLADSLQLQHLWGPLQHLSQGHGLLREPPDDDWAWHDRDILGPGCWCTMWVSANGQSLLHCSPLCWPDLSQLHCIRRLCLLDSASFLLFFHRSLTGILVSSLSVPKRAFSPFIFHRYYSPAHVLYS